MTDPNLTSKQTTEPLPKSLRDAEAEADALIAQASKSQNTVATPPAEPAAAPTPAQPAPEDFNTPQVPTTPQPSADQATWEARYKALKGKYDKEVNADVAVLQAQATRDFDMIQNLMVQVERLTQTVQQFGQNPAAPANPAENTATSAPDALNPDDFSHYGNEVVSLVETNNKLVAKVKQLEDSMSSRLDSMDSKISTTEVKTFESELAKLVPDWAKLNKDKGFINWLSNTNAPYSSESMYTLLNEKWKAGDIERTAEIFKNYKSQIANTDTVDPTPQPTLDGQIVPDTTNATPVTEKDKVPLVTEAEVEAAAKKFQTDPTNPANEAAYEDLYKKYMQQKQAA